MCKPDSVEFELKVADRLNDVAMRMIQDRSQAKQTTPPTAQFKPYMKVTERSDIVISAE